MADLTTAPITQLIELLEGGGVFASMDPAKLNLPAAWLALDEVRPANLRGDLELRCSLYLIAADRDALRCVTSLAELFNATRAVLTPDGPVTTLGVVLPADPTPMPALRVPVNLYTESE